MYVFREGRHSVSSEGLRRSLRRSLEELRSGHHSPRQNFLAIESLLRAGELECALADCNHAHQQTACCITDELAAGLVSPTRTTPSAPLEALASLALPDEVTIGVPEGFAYYALHPMQYARLAENIAFPTRRVAVVGIRSIGTTLGAVVKAALVNRGVSAERITIRPEGHPFDRVTRFSSAERHWIEAQQQGGAHFLVVDEGPGLSGSSFLATAEALVEAGVNQQRVTLLCAHQPDGARLRARDVSARIQRFTWHAVSHSVEVPRNVGVFVGAGGWRKHLFGSESAWPASWSSVERAKFFSQDATRLYKFEGLGHYGAAVHRRACALSQAGISPQPVDGMDGTGYLAYGFLEANPLERGDVSEPLLKAIAGYCAFRIHELAADMRPCQQNLANLDFMLRTNITEEFGPHAATSSHALELVKPVVTDARMQPWEWGQTDSKLIKFDSASHGDDHFFPGPTDIAWDLAGAVVEFSLGTRNEAAIARALLEHYQRLSGDDASFRLPSYLLAYSAFRLGYCKMAAQAMRGSDEEPRLLRLYSQYREFALRLLERRAAA